MEATLEFANEIVADLTDASQTLHLSDDLTSRLATTLAAATQCRDFLAEAHARAAMDRPFLWVRRVTNATAAAMSASSSLTAMHNMIGEDKIDAKGRIKDLETRCRELNARILAEPRPTVPGAGEQPLNALPGAQTSAPPVTVETPLATSSPVAEVKTSEPLPPPETTVAPMYTAPITAPEPTKPSVLDGPVAPFATVVDKPYVTPSANGHTPYRPQAISDEVPAAPVAEPAAAEEEAPPPMFFTPSPSAMDSKPASVPDALPPTLPAVSQSPSVSATPNFPAAPVEVVPQAPASTTAVASVEVAAPAPSAVSKPQADRIPTPPSEAIVRETTPSRSVAEAPDVRITLTGTETVAKALGNTVPVPETPRPTLKLQTWDDAATETAETTPPVEQAPKAKKETRRVSIPRPVLEKPKPSSVAKFIVFTLVVILIAVLVYRPILHKINIAKGDRLGARIVKINSGIADLQGQVKNTDKQLTDVRAKLEDATKRLDSVGSLLAPQQLVNSQLADVQYQIATLSSENAKLLSDINNPPSESPHDEIWHVKMAKYQATQREITRLSAQLSYLQDKAARLAPPTSANDQVSAAQQQVEDLRAQIRTLQLNRQVLQASIDQQNQYADQLRAERKEAYHPSSGLW